MTAKQKDDPLIGRTIGGSFTLHELIGIGGMGRVYRAEQTVLGRTVAVKVIHPHLLGDAQTVARFYTEAKASSRLNHPNSVSIIDFGQTDDGVLYLVMEHLTGKDLAVVMHEEGPLPFPRICHVMQSVLAALGEAHALGIVHRDLKPENIILKRLRSGSDLVKVVDFGLATIVGPGSSSITAPGVVCGTPDYMSPEQGQGDEVDGRGDLYSLGVLLFELLTERLPYEDETPTKVVLRHIGDPIPDPRVTAPSREIPDELAVVTMKALAKKADGRYQTAAELEAELAEIARKLKERGRSVLRCSACGESSSSTMRFCGSCGARLAVPLATMPPGQPSSQRWARISASSRRSLIGRKSEIEVLSEWRAAATNEPVLGWVAGEAGVGKSRLLDELAHLATTDGDLVIRLEPHASRAPVPFAPVRSALASLLGVEPSELSKAAQAFDPLERVGISEVLEPVGLTGYEERARSGAVAAALAQACKLARDRAGASRIVVVADDVDVYDGLSQAVIARLPHQMGRDPILIVAATTADRPGEPRILRMKGLEPQAARDYMNEPAPGEMSASIPPNGFTFEGPVLPLYLEHLRGLGQSSLEESARPRLADVVGQRLDRLDVRARRVMQAAAVLGDRCDRSALEALVEKGDMIAADDLGRLGLLGTHGDGYKVAHPFLRDLMEASIPAEARRALHARALRVMSEQGAPLEVRAAHAFHAGETMSAIVLLERMGDTALTRGDARAAVLAYRRALDLVRREILSTGDTFLDTALVTFSRKLGEALERCGEPTGADGVLREAMDYVGPASIDRARMLIVLARVAARRDRPQDSLRFLKEGIEIAQRLKDRAVEAVAHGDLARLRLADGDPVGAANEHRLALELLSGDRSPARARALLELADILLDMGDSAEAEKHLVTALGLEEAMRLPALSAMATGARASVDELRGDRAQAAQRYREAARLAAQAGDADAFERWSLACSKLAA